MARKLKTFTTSIGFYDLAVAAPSMKAALEAWGAKQNLFHQGLAEESEDADAVEATIAQPGVVLRRPVGTKGRFQENPALPKSLPVDGKARAPKSKAKSTAKARKTKPAPRDEKREKAAIIQFEAEKAKREKARAKQEAEDEKAQAAAERDSEKRRLAVSRAEAALDKARNRHDAKVAAIQKQLDAERDRWSDQELKLRGKIREAAHENSSQGRARE
jgi:hypothetical protein